MADWTLIIFSSFTEIVTEMSSYRNVHYQSVLYQSVLYQNIMDPTTPQRQLTERGKGQNTVFVC